MKYIFETTQQNNKDVITITISNHASSNSCKIERPNNGVWDKHIIEIFSNIIDNMRLTVKERENALLDAQTLIDYLLNTEINIPADNKMILENTISNEVLSDLTNNNEKISDEEIINAK